jgi:hypothetical protein
MGRRSKNQAPLPLEAPTRVRLSDEERSRKGHELAVIGLSIRGHRRKLTSDNRATKAEIARLEKERGELEDALIADEELRPQGELFVADLPKDQAAAALATVAAVAGEVKPSEPHAFEAVGDHGTARTMCQVCGAGKTDPIHGEAAAEDAAAVANDARADAAVDAQAAQRPKGNGKGRTHRTPGAQKARARARGKAARA